MDTQSTVRGLRPWGWVAALGLLSLGMGLAYGQRVRFPTTPTSTQAGAASNSQVPGQLPGTTSPAAPAQPYSGSVYGGLTQPTLPSGGQTLPPSATTQPVLPGASGTEAVPSPWSVPPPTGSPAPGAMTYPPGQVPYYAPAGPGVAPAPGAVYQGATPPPPNWDPYAAPGTGQQSVFPQGVIFPGVGGQDFYSTMVKFREATGLRFTSIGGNDLGVDDLELYTTFAFPFLSTSGPPLRVTPGFAFHWWSGPESNFLPGSQDMPPVTYDAYLGAAWSPQITPVLGGDLSFRLGVYSDFKKVSSEAIRFQGAGFLTLAMTPNWTLKGGVIYLDRVRVKMLPSGGAIWVDNRNDPSMEIAILFPNPRFAMRLPRSSFGGDFWWYVRGDYGGDSWAIRRTSGVNIGAVERVDYNDLRVATGLDFYRLRGLRGYVELGLAFSRELVYRDGWTDKYKPGSAIFFGGGFAF